MSCLSVVKTHQSSTLDPAVAEHTQPRHEMHNRWPQAESVEDFRHNLAAVQARIDSACLRAGRDPSEVRLLPVSKTMDEAHIRLALSMGMSGDFEIAIEEGATVVRVGQAIFGARSLPGDHFWPTEK